MVEREGGEEQAVNTARRPSPRYQNTYDEGDRVKEVLHLDVRGVELEAKVDEALGDRLQLGVRRGSTKEDTRAKLGEPEV